MKVKLDAAQRLLATKIKANPNEGGADISGEQAVEQAVKTQSVEPVEAVEAEGAVKRLKSTAKTKE